MNYNLYQAKRGKEYTIADVPDNKLLSSIGLLKGVRIKLESRYGFGGPVSISLSTRKIAVGKDIATKIYVEEVN